jgi:uncharacterized protein (TIGR03435 family)
MVIFGAAVLVAFTWCGAAAAQSESAPQFEVSSVKPSPPAAGRFPIALARSEGGPGTKDPGRATLRNFALRDLITKAYEVKVDQVYGPAWLSTVSFTSAADRFDIDAKVPEGTSKDDFRRMLQSLLSERFGLKLHRETRQGQVHSLVVGKNGPKLKDSPELPPGSEPEETAKLGPKGEDGFPIMPPSHSGMFVNVTAGMIRMKFMRRSMPEFADWLWSQVKGPVVDRTELKGRYDFYLEHGRPLPPPRMQPDGAMAASEPTGPDLQAAIQTQLGLKLTSEKGEIEMLVVDHLDRVSTGN